MTALLWRATTCAALATGGFATLSQAQDTTLAVPERPVLRRALPVASPPAPGPIVQQSPNGLYQLSITDTGIELRGPKGTVKINDTGIHIGSPAAARITVEGIRLSLRMGEDVRLESGTAMEIRAGSNLTIRGSATDIMASGPASITGAQVKLGGCTNPKPVARSGDLVNTSVSPAVIVQGTQSVLGC
ncbi:MAG: hypothetical protein ABI037_11305 [Gemmatimonadales bacterium]